MSGLRGELMLKFVECNHDVPLGRSTLGSVIAVEHSSDYSDFVREPRQDGELLRGRASPVQLPEFMSSHRKFSKRPLRCLGR